MVIASTQRHLLAVLILHAQLPNVHILPAKAGATVSAKQSLIGTGIGDRVYKRKIDALIICCHKEQRGCLPCYAEVVILGNVEATLFIKQSFVLGKLGGGH